MELIRIGCSADMLDDLREIADTAAEMYAEKLTQPYYEADDIAAMERLQEIALAIADGSILVQSRDS